MIPGSVETEFGKQTFVLLPDRAVWWPGQRTLILADVHLGKATAFRTAGLPVPTGGSVKDLARISTLLEQTAAVRLLILGDLIHAKRSRQEPLHEAIVSWRGRHPAVEMLLVRGNHDRASGRVESDWGLLEVDEPFAIEGVCFTHAPKNCCTEPTMVGHVHPVFALTDFDGSSVRADCFLFDEHTAILPAFGTFTGGHRVTADVGRRIFVATGKRVVRVG